LGEIEETVNWYFFIKTIPEETAGRTRKVKSILGELPITEKQVNKLKLKPRTQMINILEKNCLLLSGDE